MPPSHAWHISQVDVLKRPLHDIRGAEVYRVHHALHAPPAGKGARNLVGLYVLHCGRGVTAQGARGVRCSRYALASPLQSSAKSDDQPAAPSATTLGQALRYTSAGPQCGGRQCGPNPYRKCSIAPARRPIDVFGLLW